MKKILVMTCTLLALAAGMASAAGNNLSWGECGLTGIDNQIFACSVNTGLPNLLVGSVIPPAGQAVQVSGMLGIVDLQTAGATLTPWWDVGTPGCRSGAVSASYNATAEGLGACNDYFGDPAR